MKNIIQTLRAIAILLLLGYVTSATGSGLIVGNYVSGTDSNPYRSSGPTADVDFEHKNSFGKTVAVHKESSLRKIVVFDWSGVQSIGTVYCDNKDNNNPGIRVVHNYISANLNADGHKLWKTNITGLYFALELTTLATAGVSSKPQWLDNNPGVSGAKATGLVYDSGSTACSHNYIYLLGGLEFGLKIHVYADSSFNPTDTDGTNFQLLKTGGHGAVDFYFSNDQSIDSANGRHKINVLISATGLVLTWPTCSTAAKITGVDGTKVINTNQVQLGSYQPKQIKDGLSPAKFSIDMSGCAYVHNIEVKLSTSKTGKNNTELLGNQETSGAASGVGVLIEGLKSNASAQMKLLPNNSSSIYKDLINDPYTESIAGVDNYKLNFQATLKQDGSAEIIPGKFRASSTFQISYP
ncbi:fimbrial protein [Salmonella enterica subsp. salamae]|nr:fimbrial protein [Salmonella enterica subsp. enterica serovar Miami]EEJ7235820.1 fimbrial protein [Salmonella enterica subsp. salamae]